MALLLVRLADLVDHANLFVDGSHLMEAAYAFRPLILGSHTQADRIVQILQCLGKVCLQIDEPLLVCTVLVTETFVGAADVRRLQKLRKVTRIYTADGGTRRGMKTTRHVGWR